MPHHTEQEVGERALDLNKAEFGPRLSCLANTLASRASVFLFGTQGQVPHPCPPPPQGGRNAVKHIHVKRGPCHVIRAQSSLTLAPSCSSQQVLKSPGQAQGGGFLQVP